MYRRHQLAGCALALTAATLWTSAPAFAQGDRPLQLERSLLGVRLLADHREVLAKFGQPTEIQLGSPVLPTKFTTDTQTAQAGAPGMGAMARPGGGGLPGMMGGSSSMPPMMSGMRPGGGAPGMMGAMPPGMGGSSGPPSGMMAGIMGAMRGRQGGGPGGSGLPGMMGAMPGMGGSSAPPGMMGAMPGMGAGGGANATGANESGELQEATWWYHIELKDKNGNIRERRHYSFLFNKDGRVIQIQQYGYNGGGKTVKGIGLGSNLNALVRQYGWSNDGGRNGETLSLRYTVGQKPSLLRMAVGLDGTPEPGAGDETALTRWMAQLPRKPADIKHAKLAFQVVRNTVVGVTLALVIDPPPALPEEAQ